MLVGKGGRGQQAILGHGTGNSVSPGLAPSGRGKSRDSTGEGGLSCNFFEAKDSSGVSRGLCGLEKRAQAMGS